MNLRERNLAIAATIFAFILMLDQATKQWILGLDRAGELTREVTANFNLVLVWNRGMSFGILNANTAYGPWLLKGLAAVLMVMLLRWLWNATTKLQAFALGLVLGGAVGNVVDRFRYGAVVDFLDVYMDVHHWPAFNVADSAICVGVVLIFFETIVPRSRPVQESPTYLAQPSNDRDRGTL